METCEEHGGNINMKILTEAYEHMAQLYIRKYFDMNCRLKDITNLPKFMIQS